MTRPETPWPLVLQAIGHCRVGQQWKPPGYPAAVAIRSGHKRHRADHPDCQALVLRLLPVRPVQALVAVLAAVSNPCPPLDRAPRSRDRWDHQLAGGLARPRLRLVLTSVRVLVIAVQLDGSDIAVELVLPAVHSACQSNHVHPAVVRASRLQPDPPWHVACRSSDRRRRLIDQRHRPAHCQDGRLY